MRSFLIKGQSLEAKATYNEETGLLCGTEIVLVKPSKDHADYQVLMGFLSWLCIKTRVQEMVDSITAPSSSPIKVTEIAPDLSFTAFWDAFDYKMGNKSRAEAAWHKMGTEDRNACILSIKRYKTWKKLNPSIGHIYAETFLSQRRWENEYKIN